MVKVEFLGPIGKASIEIEANTLAEVSKILKEEEDISHWLSQCAVAVNDVMISDLDFSLKDGDKISILPPVCGG